MPAPALELKSVTPADGPALAEIRAEAMRESLEAAGRFDPVRVRARFLEGFDPPTTRAIVVAGERVGFVVVRPTEDHLLLDHLYLTPAAQGQRIGERVLRSVFAESDRARKPLRVGALKGSRSNAFYLRHGFQWVESGEWDNYYVRPPAPFASPTLIILASGRGERFAASGGAVHKLRAMLGDKPVLEHTLATAHASGLPWHVEDAGHPGMGDSIAAAVRATAGANGWLILPGDLPLVLPTTLQTLAQALAQHAMVVPVHAGRRGHPVGFSAALGPALMQLSGPQGAASIARAHGAHLLAVDDEGCVTDIDTVSELAAAEALWWQRRA